MTIHNALNYGALFQAYATQEVLSKYGNVDIIDYQNKHIEKVYKTFNVGFNHSLPKSLIRDLFLLKGKFSKKRKFKNFFNSRLKFTESTDFRKNNLKAYDLYVSGSDQIWNPLCTNGNSIVNEHYFLQFAPAGARKISYATSLGSFRFKADQQEKVKTLLESFDYLSVREKDGKEYLESLLDKEVKQVLDPTLLLSKSDWINKLGLKEKEFKTDYILVYTVPRSDLLKEVVSYYAQKDIRIIAVDSNIRKLGPIDEQIRDAGPEEFLNLFLNAKKIITDSFHGVCFSINFQKDFLAISSGRQSNRMKNILELIGLQDRFISSIGEVSNLNNMSSVNFTKAQKLLEEKKIESFKYLSKAITAESE